MSVRDIYMGNGDGSDNDTEDHGEPEPVSTRQPKRKKQDTEEAPENEEEIPGEGEGSEEAPQEEQEPETPSDPLKRRKLQVLIRAYLNRFGNRLQGLDFSNLEKTEEELEADLRDIRFLVAASSPGAPYKIVANIGVAAWERLCVDGLDYKVTGLSAYLKRDEEWKDLVDEMALEYAEVFHQPVYMRVGFKLMQSTYMLHEMNTAPKLGPCAEPVPQQVKSKFSGL
jgi:hypothetical protein